MRRIVISFFVWGFALWIVAQNGPQSLITEYGGVYIITENKELVKENIKKKFQNPH